MADPARREATYEDLLAVPAPLVAQLIDGEIHAHRRPASAHARGTSKLGGWLDRHFDDDDGGGPGGWVILDEPELHFGRDILVPDIAGWRRSRMPEMPLAPYFTLAPTGSARAYRRGRRTSIAAASWTSTLASTSPTPGCSIPKNGHTRSTA